MDRLAAANNSYVSPSDSFTDDLVAPPSLWPNSRQLQVTQLLSL
jgi:hypothetical protein